MTLRAIAVAKAGAWPLTRMLDEVAFDYDRRYRRRMRFAANAGTDVLLDLAEAVHISDGDALVLESGKYIRINSLAEALLEITAPDAHTLMRLAWHLGNRHLAVQFLPGRLRILDDRVIAEMITQLGGSAVRLTAPFDPESGAYDHG